MNRQLDTYLRPMISYLIGVRPLSISLGNVVRFVKGLISKIPPNTRANEVGPTRRAACAVAAALAWLTSRMVDCRPSHRALPGGRGRVRGD